MWIRILLIFCVIVALFHNDRVSVTATSAATSNRQNDLDVLFEQRSRSDWIDVWHHERHARCREKLIKHLFWACEKDIYRVQRRSDKQFAAGKLETYDNDDYNEPKGFPWINERAAFNFLRDRRRSSSSSITSECCSIKGCTWEEYAEYCPTNKRHIKF